MDFFKIIFKGTKWNSWKSNRYWKDTFFVMCFTCMAWTI